MNSSSALRAWCFQSSWILPGQGRISFYGFLLHWGAGELFRKWRKAVSEWSNVQVSKRLIQGTSIQKGDWMWLKNARYLFWKYGQDVRALNLRLGIDITFAFSAKASIAFLHELKRQGNQISGTLVNYLCLSGMVLFAINGLLQVTLSVVESLRVFPKMRNLFGEAILAIEKSRRWCFVKQKTAICLPYMMTVMSVSVVIWDNCKKST